MNTLSCSNGRFWRLPPFHSQRTTRNTRKEISIPSGLVDSTGGTGYRFPLKQALTAGSLALTGDTIAQPRQGWMKAKALKEQSFSYPHRDSLKDKVRSPTRSSRSRGTWSIKCSSTCSFIGATIPPRIELSEANGVTQFLNIDMHETSHAASNFMHKLVLVDLDPATAKLAIGFIGPCLSAFGFLFILRIVMSWYPKLPVEKFPYVVAYAPTEPLLSPTRKLIPPLAGVDVTPVVWFGLISFLSEILVGPQGLLVLLSQQV